MYLYSMKPNTKLKGLNRDEIRQLLVFCKRYCEMTFGRNNRKRTSLRVEAAPRAVGDKKICGWYCPYDNKITIFTKTCKTIKEFTSTFIHEYTHYMQPCRTKYQKLLKEHGYKKHPFEIQAYSTEKHYNKKLLRVLKITKQLLRKK